MIRHLRWKVVATNMLLISLVLLAVFAAVYFISRGNYHKNVQQQLYQALEQGDFDRFLALVRESGRSSAMYLQNIIPTGSTAAQELMVTIALCEALLADRGAVRVHGGGFGGTAQAFVPLEQLDSFKEKTEAVLGQGRCHTVMIRPAGGVRLG